jgi:hypothetical protein
MNNLEIPQPDPSWDYYVLWHSLHHIKAKIEDALKILGVEENAKLTLEREIKKLLDPASDKFIAILEQLPYVDDEDDDA